MEPSQEENMDGSSIKPVSSLRSHFENMLHINKSPVPPPSVSPRHPSPNRVDTLKGLEQPPHRTDGRISLDMPRQGGQRNGGFNTDYNGSGPLTPGPRPPRTPTSKPKPRPTSMMALSPPMSPPQVTVQSPRSPPKLSDSPLQSPVPLRTTPSSALFAETSRDPSPQANSGKNPRIPSRATTPAMEAKLAPFLQASTAAKSAGDPRKSASPERDVPSTSKPLIPSPLVPPPINRAGKPKIPSKSPSLESSAKSRLAPEPVPDPYEERVSPFSTPPSSEGSNQGEEPSPPFRALKPKISKGKIPPLNTDSYFPPPPKHHAVADKQKAPTDARTIGFHAPSKDLNARIKAASDAPEDRPYLPPRRDTPDTRRSMQIARAPPPEPPVRRSMDTFRPVATANEATSKFMPPPKRTQTYTEPSTTRSQALQPPNPRPIPRTSGELKRPISSLVAQAAPANYDSDDIDTPVDKGTPTLTDYPDSSQANRRPPLFRSGAKEIPTKYDTKLFAICGEYICTTGYVTRVWSLLTGELLVSLSHGDTVKVTALSFRPAKEVEDEGKKLWLGTNTGEIHEVDIETQGIAHTKPNAHGRTAIIKIFRYASEMWSLDEEGKLHIWPPDETGCPSLGITPLTFRVPRGHTFSLISGTQLWIATGKDIRVFQRVDDGTYFTQVLQKPLSQPGVGDVTSGAILSSQPDRIYFGHNDGKVTIYAKKDFACLGVVSVSLYKISSLVGVGDHLWAGYITGMIYVYDTTSQPWKVMKDWHAHESAIAGIAVDRTSIWKLDRLQVGSLGTDNMLRIWDGMLRDDWLEAQMQEHDADYCDFREITAKVMTWNAGASKPTSLRHDERDANFFRELLQARDAPDILVFGFQELVDLEDKKVTAKSFFKKSKKKTDASEHEHMSHQYRAWRDHLVRMIDEHVPSDTYALLHSANLVGLFTCVFVKASEKAKIRDVCAAEVKLGMGGLHGNKGALIVRFILDDSSFCFVNCHLAAGQSQTVHRNNDIAAIMETDALPRRIQAAGRTDLFVGGGDGSMILDHEICILNGDLNYRIDSMTRDRVVQAVKENNLAKLLERDQLLLSRKRNPGFRLRAFREMPITFAPTYKYDVGTDTYDSSEKRRSPAWCDRLLYRGLGRIKQVDYRRHEVRVSDHRPVSGTFKIRIKTINTKRQIMTRETCEQEFEEVKRRIAADIKLDYLVNVFGCSIGEAKKLLKL